MERPLAAAGAADQYVVGAAHASARQDGAGELTQAALHAVAHDGAADLLRDGDSDAQRPVAVLAGANEQDEAGRGSAQGPVRREIVGAPRDFAERRRG